MFIYFYMYMLIKYIDIRYIRDLHILNIHSEVFASHYTSVSVAKVTDALGSALAFVGLKNEVKEREDLGRETPGPNKNSLQLIFI